MPTETGTIDLKAQKAGHDAAAKTASDYITEITSDGIWVTPHDAKPVNGAPTSTTRGWHIADALEYFRGTVRYIKAWLNGTVPTVRLGQDSSGHADVTPSGLEVFTDSSTSVASFGSTARIGKDGGRRVDVKADGMTFYGNDNDPYFKVIDYPGTGNYSDETYMYTGDGTKKRFALPKVSTLYNVTVTNGTAGTVTKYSTYFEFSTAPTNGASIQVQARFYEGAAKAYTLGVRGGDESSIGMYSVAEGFNTIAVGNFSRAQNLETIAKGENQTVIGKFNLEDFDASSSNPAGKYAFIIGNGNGHTTRGNALMVDWDGGIYSHGHVTPIGTVLSAHKTGISVAAGIDSYANGASVTLYAGTYVVWGEFVFNTGSGSAACATTIAFGTSSSVETISRHRVIHANPRWNALSSVYIVSVSSQTTYYVKGSSDTARSGCESDIKAVRIA